MNATRNGGLAAVLVALLGTMAGCGGAAEFAAPRAPSGAKAGVAYEEGPAPSAAPEPPPPPIVMSGRASIERKDSGPSAHRSEDWAPRAPAERPGLGTEWGETRLSRISTVPFVRADRDSPFATASLFYNDEEGARAMASATGFRRTSGGLFNSASGLVSIGLRDSGGTFFNGFVAGGRNYTVGEAGSRYTIVVHNNTDSRLEVVLSVDGLDVLDGRAANFGKRGYLVEPRGELEVDGFRQSEDTVAAFRFGSVRGSYAAQKHGDTRNVGVIGIALFNERGTSPFPWTNEEVNRRRNANPFPGQFASPP